MAEFKYKVKTTKGDVLDGMLESKNRDTAIDKLSKRSFTIISIDEVEQRVFFGLNSIIKPRIKNKDMVVFSKQLSTLVSSGINLSTGLEILSNQSENIELKKILDSITRDIEAGLSLSDAMEKFEKVFSELYINMVRAGEAGGILDIVLEKVAKYLEDAYNTRSKIRGAFIYPIIICVVAISVVVFLLLVIIPSFSSIFSGFGKELPFITQVFLGLSNIIRSYFLLILGVSSALIFALIYYYRTENGRKDIDSRLLDIPVFGILFRKMAVYKFTNTLGSLISSGIHILEAIKISAKTVGNKSVEDKILRAKNNIAEGETITDSFKRVGIFPPMVIEMISVGETSGKLDTMLFKVTEFYEEDVRKSLETISVIIEPIVILVMGLIVGLIIIAMFLPIFDMSQIVT